ncbi:DHA2 family efflux MFS transporter permease subunit [bacterium BFN5]|nr:DHA2 family efflux MFS transporter permease subunit [bacterium BFN5]QJW46070.1 DHA2 family efflux MFS transporter permease subunit [bacterium BFN5]
MLKKYAILLAVCLGTVLSAYVSSCVNIALPNIMAALNFNMDSIVWVSLGYMLPYGSTLPLTGKLGDQFGAKKVYVLGMILFTIASLLCGIATNSAAMVFFRIIQGIGAGMLLPNAMTIVAETFDAHERGQALGVWSAMAAAGSAMGPTIGGYLIEKFDWRTVFFSVGPICVISVVFALIIIPASRRNSGVKIDYLGASLLIAGISSLLVALNQGQKEGWDSLYILLLFYSAFAAFVLFFAVEFRVANPMIDMRLFRTINFSMANIVGFISFVAFYGGMFLLPFFLKSNMNYSSTTAGMMMLPLTATMVVFSPFGGRLADRFGSRLPAFIGIMMIAAALYSLDTINTDYSGRDFFLRLSLFGAGLGLTMSPLTNCAVSSLPKDKIGVGSGIFNLSKIIGGSIGVVFAETLLTRREIYHTAVLKEYLNPEMHSSLEIFQLLQGLWGQQGMDSEMLATAARGWLTGYGMLPQQYMMFKALLSNLVARQASILSFQDVFHTVAILCFAGGMLALLIRRRACASNT